MMKNILITVEVDVLTLLISQIDITIHQNKWTNATWMFSINDEEHLFFIWLVMDGWNLSEMQQIFFVMEEGVT